MTVGVIDEVGVGDGLYVGTSDPSQQLLQINVSVYAVYCGGNTTVPGLAQKSIDTGKSSITPCDIGW